MTVSKKAAADDGERRTKRASALMIPQSPLASPANENRAFLDRDGSTTTSACALRERKSESNRGTGRITRKAILSCSRRSQRSDDRALPLPLSLSRERREERVRTLPHQERESYSPLARDVEVDDLALVVDHGGSWKFF